jgi:hypothetical protein
LLNQCPQSESTSAALIAEYGSKAGLEPKGLWPVQFLHLGMLGEREHILDIDAEAANCALGLGVTQ